MYMVQKKQNEKSEERKLKRFLFNTKASLVICVDSVRTHLLVSCLLTGPCRDKEVYDQARVMFYTLTLLIPSLLSL